MKTKLIEVVRQLKELDTLAQEYISKVPTGFDVIYDNDYANTLGQINDVLVQALFKDYSADIFWFLYEWKPGKNTPQIILEDGTEIILETEEDYYQYLKDYC